MKYKKFIEKLKMGQNGGGTNCPNQKRLLSLVRDQSSRGRYDNVPVII